MNVLAERVAEAALAYRKAEAVSERDPEGFLQAQMELDLALAEWEKDR